MIWEVRKMNTKKAPNNRMLDTLNTNPTFIFLDNGLVIHSDEYLIKVDLTSVEPIEKH